MPYRRCRRFFLAAIAFAGLAPQGTAQEPGELDGRADYRIACRVDELPEGEGEGHGMQLAGELTVTWSNGSQDSVGELWFHLYHNAFANNRSTMLAADSGRLGGPRMRGGWGWQRVTAIATGGADLMPGLRYRVAADGSPDDLTVFSVELPRPVPPGGTIAVDVAWEARIPRVRRRTGEKDGFLLLAHWFPKLGVYESGRGWNCHPFYANTEFYADYGTYDVTLDLPEAYGGRGTDVKVGASGVEVGPSSKAPGRVIKRFVAPSERDRDHVDRTGKKPLVHGFAWTADPAYRAYVGTFHFDDWAAKHPAAVDAARRAFGPDKDLRLRDVDVTVLLHPERWSQAERHFDATCAALFFYGLWYGEYPYEHITAVDPAWGAQGAGGMEYPTLFTCGTRLFTFPGMHTPESVTVHECGHQFWYGLVGNNEFEAAWLDEGLNSYTDSEVMWACYGERRRTSDYARVPFDGVPAARGPGDGEGIGLAAEVLSGRRWPIPWLKAELSPLEPRGFVSWWRDQPLLAFVRQRDDPRQEDRARYLQDPDTDPIDTEGWRYVDRRSYGINSYPRTAVALRTLKGLVGEEAFLRGMRRFSERWRYAHPYPEDFFRDFAAGAEKDLAWFFDELFRGTGTVDWSVAVEQRRVPAKRGFFQAVPGAPFEKVAPDPALAALEEGEDEGPGDDGGNGGDGDGDGGEQAGDARPWAVDLVLRRKGTLALPLTVEIAFADGTTLTREWTREAQLGANWWRPLGRWAEHPAKLASVVLDPEGRYPLDLDLSNNRWYDAVDERAPLRWAERALTRLAHALHWYAGIGG